MGIQILQERGNFKGGFCLLFCLIEEKFIVVNKLKLIEQRMRVLAKAFSILDTSSIYLKPIIREMIESEHASPQLNTIK